MYVGMVCCSVLQCVAVCCSVLQCVAVYVGMVDLYSVGMAHCDSFCNTLYVAMVYFFYLFCIAKGFLLQYTVCRYGVFLPTYIANVKRQ